MLREEILQYMQSDIYTPLTVQELADVFEQQAADDFRSLVKLMNELEEGGSVVRTKNNRYGLPEAMNLVLGKLQMKARGFGFVISENEGESDVYIPSTEMNGAMSGDKVLVKVSGDGKGGPHREGVIARVVERATNRLVGKVTLYQNHAFVEPMDKQFQEDVFVDKKDTMDAHDGYVVLVELTAYPSDAHGARGRVIEVLGHPNAPGVDILSVIRKYRLPEEFADVVLKAAESIPIEISQEEAANRRDLRDEVIVTIDGEDAKDLDDAVHVKELENGHLVLGVHIADVGYYVKEGGAIDQEAFRRGTSVYLVDRVIPMLPERLSNNICSLNPQVDRLTMSCVMEIDAEGNVVSHDIFPSIIKTTARMTYTNVRQILVDHDEDVIEKYRSLVPLFQRMETLALILRERRMKRGAIDFEFDEIYVKVDELGHPTDIVPRKRSIAEKLIEEFMLVANETVAEHFHWLGVPFVYRVHDEPDAGKMFDLNAFLHNFGHHLKGVGGSKIHPRALQEVLGEVEGTREARMISTVMLRSMQQAKYKPECTGHFGLAAEYYTHFTSPIRRYPDLTIHRIMREVLAGRLSPSREEALRAFVEEASRQSSERERLAQDAEREVDQLKMVEYMQDHVGESFDGIISSVTSFGCFIQLDNGVEGLIHISTLSDDYYVFNDKQMALIGERNRRVFRMGDPVRVEVARASKEDLQIDFALLAHHREATFVTDGRRSGEIVYDEDLSPKDRRKSELRREEMSSAAPKRGRIKGAGRDGRIDQGSRKGTSPGTVSGGFGRSARDRAAEPRTRAAQDAANDWRGKPQPDDMPYDEWDADFPDPREAREQANAESTGRSLQNRDRRRSRSSADTGAGASGAGVGRPRGGRDRDRKDGSRSGQQRTSHRPETRNADGGRQMARSQSTEAWQEERKKSRDAANDRRPHRRSSSNRDGGVGDAPSGRNDRDRGRSGDDGSSDGRRNSHSRNGGYRAWPSRDNVTEGDDARGSRRGGGSRRRSDESSRGGARSGGGSSSGSGRARSDGGTGSGASRAGSGSASGPGGKRASHKSGVRAGAKAAGRKFGGRSGGSGSGSSGGQRRSGGSNRKGGGGSKGRG